MNISNVIAHILAILDANEGRVLYKTLHDDMSYRELRLLMPALRQLKVDGVARKSIRIVDRRPIHEVFRIPA